MKLINKEEKVNKMIIYPKTSDTFQGLEALKPLIGKNGGTEIQMLTWEDIDYLNEIIDKMMNEVPSIQEITVHPPLIEDFNFEVLSYANFEEEIKRVKCITELSEKYNIKMNLLYHTRWDYECWKSSGEIERMNQLVGMIKNTQVTILIENIYSMVDKEDSAVLKIAREIDNEKLKVCIDICHLHCQANIFKMDFEEFLNNYLNKEDCKKYVYQIHFAGTLKNDGYIDKATHGRKHDSIESLSEDYNVLKKYDMDDKIIVSEVSEDDYSTRIDQIAEIQMLNSL